MFAALTLYDTGPRPRVDYPITTDHFLFYVRHCLAPILKPDRVVIADNLRAAAWAAFNAITPADAASRFTHRGYPPP